MTILRNISLFILLLLFYAACSESPTVAPGDDVAVDEARFKGGPPDSDGDGIPNNRDDCPDDPTNTCNDGGGDPGTCALTFDLNIVETGMSIRSDGLGTYSDGTDKVIVFTGSSGDGWRFDTNGSQKIEGRRDKRKVTVDFSGTPVAGLFQESSYTGGLDARFFPQGAALNLCDMAVDETASVDIGVSFASEAPYSLGYGADCPNGGAQAGVTRTGDSTWEMTGTNACLNEGLNLASDAFAMPFQWTITAQN